MADQAASPVVRVIPVLADVQARPLNALLSPDKLAEVLAHLFVKAPEKADIGLASVDSTEADVVELRAREKQASGGEEAGQRRHNRCPGPKLRGKRGCVPGRGGGLSVTVAERTTIFAARAERPSLAVIFMSKLPKARRCCRACCN